MPSARNPNQRRIIAKAMSILGSAKSERKRKAARANLKKANAVRLAGSYPTLANLPTRKK